MFQLLFWIRFLKTVHWMKDVFFKVNAFYLRPMFIYKKLNLETIRLILWSVRRRDTECDIKEISPHGDHATELLIFNVIVNNPNRQWMDQKASSMETFYCQSFLHINTTYMGSGYFSLGFVKPYLVHIGLIKSHGQNHWIVSVSIVIHGVI